MSDVIKVKLIFLAVILLVLFFMGRQGVAEEVPDDDFTALNATQIATSRGVFRNQKQCAKFARSLNEGNAIKRDTAVGIPSANKERRKMGDIPEERFWELMKGPITHVSGRHPKRRKVEVEDEGGSADPKEQSNEEGTDEPGEHSDD